MPKPTPIRHQGNENLFLAVEMSVVSTLAGIPLHVHAEGLRGTGKTTVMRWARNAMPKIRRVKGCPFQCDPQRPHCPLHSALAGSTPFETEDTAMPFVEIGHGAKLGTVLGSIDLARLTDRSRPEAALLPGAIPMAHRGIILVDEVNRLAETAPEITDVLLSVMGTKPGRVKIEEVGLPACEIDVTSSVWAASNPDEDPGPLEDIRKQLADRFDLVVPVQRPSDAAIVEKLLLRTPFEDSPRENLLDNSRQASSESLWMAGLVEKAESLRQVTVPPAIVKYIAQLYVQRNVESLRAIEALELSSRLKAALEGRFEVSFDDLLSVIPLVLRHRVEPLILSEILKDLELRKAAGVQVKPLPETKDASTAQPPDKNSTSGQNGHLGEPGPDGTSRPKEAATGTKHEQPAVLQKTGDRTTPTWLQRLMSKYSSANQGVSGGSGASGQSGAMSPQLTDPKKTPPVSPPDAARRISYLSWEELVVPPEWKDNPK